jgi:hypothetical protein
MKRSAASAKGPNTGASSRTLGARPGLDIPVAGDGSVEPETGGMSVSPAPPENLPVFRRPARYDGTGKDPVYEMETDALPFGLVYRPDPDNPETHGFIEPAYRMTFEEYQALIHATRGLWGLV